MISGELEYRINMIIKAAFNNGKIMSKQDYNESQYYKNLIKKNNAIISKEKYNIEKYINNLMNE